uniref:Histone-lysine N-methyltransferase SETMAR n=1 Tax=Strongyloides venezuelensis TaxID=75913 RepID=A0A0K0G4S4_STRVS
MTVWWSALGVTHYKFMKPGETIYSEFFCQVLKEMHEKLFKKMPALVNRKEPILFHDNAKPHVSKKTSRN